MAPLRTSTGGLAQWGGPLVIGATFFTANPTGLASRSGIGAGWLATLRDRATGEIALLLTAFFVGSMLRYVAISIVLSKGHRFTSPRLLHWVDVLSGSARLYFAVRLPVSALRHPGALLVAVVRALL